MSTNHSVNPLVYEGRVSETYMFFLHFFTPAELTPHKIEICRLSLSSKGEPGSDCFTHSILGILYIEYGNTSVHLAFVEGLINFSFSDVLRNAFWKYVVFTHSTWCLLISIWGENRPDFAIIIIPNRLQCIYTYNLSLLIRNWNITGFFVNGHSFRSWQRPRLHSVR